MFERFTKAARETVTNAVAIAGERGDQTIGTEHLLAGVAATDSPTAKVLETFGAGSERVKAAILELDKAALASVGIDQEMIRVGPTANEWARKKRHIPFSRAAKGALEEALREALAREDRFIGSEHILAALTSTGDNDPARRILAGLGIDIALLRKAVFTNG